MPKKFVSHSHKDNQLVVPFVEDLRNAGLEVWVDLEQIDHDDFIKRMNQGLAVSDWVVLVQTPHSLPARSTAVEMEINAALAKKLRGALRDVIPFIMAPCDANEVPDIWQALHHYDAVRDGYARALTGLLRALGVTSGPRTISPVLAALLPGAGQAVPTPAPPRPQPAPPPLTLPPEKLPPRLAQLGFTGQVRAVQGRPVELLLPPVCAVEAGPFWMGSQNDPQAWDNEPWHQVTTGAYAIGKYPVTVAEYACAVRAGKVAEPPKPTWNNVTWADQLKLLDHPVVNVSWLEAQKYVEWLAGMTGEPWRLPTEAEWEKAARWDAARQVSWIYPWGDDFDAQRANTDNRVKTTTPVGTYAAEGDASPYGCHDMAGNVWEWTSSIYDASAYQPDNKRENNSDKTSVRVLRGGSWSSYSRVARAAIRDRGSVGSYLNNCGFRLVRGVGAGSH